MTPAKHVYSVLLVSAAKKMNTAMMPLLEGERYGNVSEVDTIAGARRMLVEREYDLVIINAPLPDDFGRKFAVDVCTDSNRAALLLVRSEMYDEICYAMSDRGVMVAKKPMELSNMEQFLNATCSVVERLKGLQNKTMTLEEKMEEIRLVNRAKWALIKSCSMTEEDAHRYIQKQAMDLCMSKRETAEKILSTYG
jgi:response regulator NasT